MGFSKPKVYLKDTSFDPIYNQVNKSFVFKSRILPIGLLFLGTFILITQVVLPLVVFKTQDQISSPISNSVLGVASGFGNFEFDELQNSVNETTESDTNIPQYFYLTIPKLRINKALVETNSPTLNPDEALGHYKGTALPGKVGNTFIYGHSVLPWFYNPKNYKTIFSTIDKLAVGDVFYIEYNNQTLEYKVETKSILKTEQVEPLAELKPRYLNESTVVLMTCYPMGTKSKRLLVNAVRVN